MPWPGAHATLDDVAPAFSNAELDLLSDWLTRSATANALSQAPDNVSIAAALATVAASGAISDLSTTSSSPPSR